MPRALIAWLKPGGVLRSGLRAVWADEISLTDYIEIHWEHWSADTDSLGGLFGCRQGVTGLVFVRKQFCLLR